jgi:hypothetical protein
MYFELHLEILDQNMLKAKFDVVFDFMSQKSNVNFVILHFTLFVPQLDLSMFIVLQIESMDDYLLYLEFIVTFLVRLL